MRYRRPVVQLTTLLDLLFIMIFVSLNQAHQANTAPEPKAAQAPKMEAPKTPAPKKEPEAIPQERPITADFIFYGTPTNPRIPAGSYKMKGTFYPQTGVLQLGGVSWIKRVPNYDMVPLTGVMDANRTSFTGNIEFEGCEEFTLKRVTSEQGSEIAGNWKGKYSCLQGETGLTLRIY